MIYLDNAATSFPKPEKVIAEVSNCMKEYCANPGRGSYEIAIKSSEVIWETRSNIAKLFNINNPERVIFTKNATEAINIGLKGVIEKGAHVITTSMEHNSVIRPLKCLEREGIINLTILECNRYGEIDLDNIKGNIKSNTGLFVCTLCSNVNGTIMPISRIRDMLDMSLISKNKIILFVDASQGAGYLDLNVEKMGIDLMAFPGHKSLFGPQGTGGLYIREGISIRTLTEGGTGTDSINLYHPEEYPEHLESGTLNTPGIAGLNEGIKFIQKIGIETIRKHKEDLSKRLFLELRSLDKTKLYSCERYLESGIISLNFDGVDSTEVAFVLDKVYSICTRAGLHCSPLAHKTIGTQDIGSLRISLGYYNTQEEINYTINALKEIHCQL
jgi:cysteine desulfurase / selenocysteine lyase